MTRFSWTYVEADTAFIYIHTYVHLNFLDPKNLSQDSWI